MSDHGRERETPHCSERAVELRVAPLPENLAVVRMLVGAVGAFEDLDVDRVADLRLAIDELCTQLIRCAAPAARLLILVDPREHEVVVRASAVCGNASVIAPGSFSWHVITSLTDDAQVFHDDSGQRGPGDVFGVALTMRRAGADR